MMPFSAEMLGFLLGLLVIVLTGLADDIWDISPRWKFLGLFAGSLLLVMIGHVQIDNLGNLFALGDIETGMLAIPITVVATVGFINALNLSDGLDGLAGGIALIAVFFLGYFSLHAGDQLCLLLSITLFGALVGFLYFNSHPARIFMGDTGSLVLGYVLAAISLLLIKGHASGDTAISPIVMGTLLGLPLADTLFVMGQRVMQGGSPFLPDKTHFHHRLLQLGLTHNGAVAVMYALMMLYGVAALILIHASDWLQLASLLGLIAVTYGVLYCLERGCVDLHLRNESKEIDLESTGYFYRWMTISSGRSIPWATWLIPAFLLVPAALLTVKGPMLLVVGSAIVLGAALYPWREKHDATWLTGIVYLLVFAPILATNLIGEAWLKEYLFAASGLLLLWVAIKLYFKRHGRIFLSSGLEVLLLMFSWVGPWLVHTLGLLSQQVQEVMYLVCFQSVIFLLAIKIVLRHQPRRNRVLVISLLTVNALLLL